ncbi:serine/threonine-protein kinase ATM [Artemisia annua]|uniref:Serine/threonine-protein kinase ATM n=1 Tax=Artemisia annua TaxID=35608 RepID=A0A2U1LDQ0_ARTAN|nr:serine/threonine-protein kinase ATM [Artemisia annua]
MLSYGDNKNALDEIVLYLLLFSQLMYVLKRFPSGSQGILSMVFIHDPLYKWALSPLKALEHQKATDYDLEASLEDSEDQYEGNKDAARALLRVKQKHDGYEEGEMRSVHGQKLDEYEEGEMRSVHGQDRESYTQMCNEIREPSIKIPMLYFQVICSGSLNSKSSLI